MGKRVATVVVGYGNAARRIHLPLIQMQPNLHLRGVCSSDPQKREEVAGIYGCRTYATLEDTLGDPDVRLVVLTTPNPVHAPQAIAALNAGKHVVTDKPMCLSSADAHAMIEAADRNRCVLSVFHNRRWDGDYLTLAQEMKYGELGDVRWLEVGWQRYGMPTRWRGQSEMGGGKLIDLGSHMIDQVLLLFPGKVKSIYCRKHFDFVGTDVESHALLVMGFEDGRTAVVDTTAMSHSPKPRLLALGSKATFIKYGSDPQEAALAAGDIGAATEPESQFAQIVSREGSRTVPSIPGRWPAYYENVADVLMRDDPYSEREAIAVKPEEAARVVAVLEHAAESARAGRAVAVDV